MRSISVAVDSALSMGCRSWKWGSVSMGRGQPPGQNGGMPAA
jgi:hypothetical protein